MKSYFKKTVCVAFLLVSFFFLSNSIQAANTLQEEVPYKLSTAYQAKLKNLKQLAREFDDPEVITISSFETQDEWTPGGELADGLITDLTEADGQLVPNAGMELDNNSDGLVDSFEYWGPDPQRVENPYTGSYGMQIQFGGLGWVWTPEMPVTASKTYTFSFKYKVLSGTGTIGLAVDNGSRTIDVIEITGATPDGLWHEASNSFICDTTENVILVMAAPNITLVTDDWYLGPTPLDPEYQKEKIFNNSMEYDVDNDTQTDTFSATGACAQQRSSTYSKSGTYSLQASFTGAGGTLTSPSFSVTEGNTYVANFCYKYISGSGKLRFKVMQGTTELNFWEINFNSSSNTEWKCFPLSNIKPDIDTDNYTLAVAMVGSGNLAIAFDDWSFQQPHQYNIPVPERNHYFHFRTPAGDESKKITLEKSGLNLDLSNSNLRFWIKEKKEPDAATNLYVDVPQWGENMYLAAAYMYIYSGEAFKKYRLNYTYRFNKWSGVDVNRGNYIYESGTMNWQSVNKIVFEFIPADGKSIEFMIDDLKAVESFEDSFITFLAMDGPASFYDYAKPYLDIYNYKGCISVNPDRVDEMHPFSDFDTPKYVFDWLSGDQLRMLEAQGHDVLPQTSSFGSWPVMSGVYDPASDEFDPRRSLLYTRRGIEWFGLERGTRFHRWTDGLLCRIPQASAEEEKKIFCGSIAFCGGINSIPLVSPYLIHSGLANVIEPDVDSIKDSIDKVIEYGGWLILSADVYYFSGDAAFEDWTEIVDYVHDYEASLHVVTFSDMFDSGIMTKGNQIQDSPSSGFIADIEYTMTRSYSTHLMPFEFGTSLIDASENAVVLTLPSLPDKRYDDFSGLEFKFVVTDATYAITISAEDGDFICSSTCSQTYTDLDQTGEFIEVVGEKVDGQTYWYVTNK